MNLTECARAARDIEARYLTNEPAVRTPDGNSAGHLRWMLQEIYAMRMSEAKAMRWLGYVQGFLVASGVAKLEDMKEASRAAVYGDKPEEKAAPEGLTTMEWEILQECAGVRQTRAWGAAVGACLEALHDRGYVVHGALTDKGRTLLEDQGLLKPARGEAANAAQA